MYNFNKISIFSVCSIDVQIYRSCGEGGGGDNIQIYFKFNKIYTTLSESPPPPDLSAGSVPIARKLCANLNTNT